jgi:hypothetical protein
VEPRPNDEDEENEGTSRLTMMRRSDGTSRTTMTGRRGGASRTIMRGYNGNSTGWNETATRKRSRGSTRKQRRGAIDTIL